jgi:hypothetical protein
VVSGSLVYKISLWTTCLWAIIAPEKNVITDQ